MEYVSRPHSKPFRDADAVNDLECKIIEDFKLFLKEVRKGHKPDYEHILRKIMILEDGILTRDNYKLYVQYFLK